MPRTRAMSVIVIILLAASCGGESGGAVSATTMGSTPATEGTSTSAPSSGMGLSGRAVVTVGDQTWEFSLEGLTATCIYFAGHTIAGVGFTTTPDGERETFQNRTAVALSFDLPVPGGAGEAEIEPAIIVTDNIGDVEWRAGGVGLLPGIPSGSSQVDDWQVGDGTATATATFLEWNAASTGGELIVRTGTLEASCG